MSRARDLSDYVSTGVSAAEFDQLDTTSGTPGSGNFLRGDKTWASAGGGITGPGSATDNALVRFDGTGGSTAQNSTVVVDDNGHMTNGSQPAFLVQGGNDSNVTGDATVYAVPFAASEIYDQNADFETSSPSTLFTAPVTGRYYLNVHLDLRGITSSHTTVEVNIVTSNRWHYLITHAGSATAGAKVIFVGSCLADMDSADTAYVRLMVSGDVKVVDVWDQSYFQGFLVC